jgi:hypothetical protein
MPSPTGEPFNHRAFVSMMIAAAGIGLPITGIANHLLQFEPMTVQRHAWMAAHNSLGFLFVIFALWHVLLNRRALLNHARGLAARATAVSREAVYAVAVIVLTTAVAAGHAFHVPSDYTHPHSHGPTRGPR